MAAGAFLGAKPAETSAFAHWRGRLPKSSPCRFRRSEGFIVTTA
jgi:hypothetical protein